MEHIEDSIANHIRATAKDLVDRELLEEIYFMLSYNKLTQQYAAKVAHEQALGFVQDAKS